MTVKKAYLASLLFLSCLLFNLAASAQNEIAVTVGGITKATPTVSGLAITCPIFGCPPAASSVDGGFALNASFARRFVNLRLADFSLELPVTVVPSRGTDIAVSNIRTVAFTPGIKFGLNPNGGISPFAAVGFGLAHFSGGSTSSSNAFALNAGGGADFKTPIPLLALRGEVRYLRTGLPDVFHGDGHLNNVYFGAGVVLKF